MPDSRVLTLPLTPCEVARAHTDTEGRYAPSCMRTQLRDMSFASCRCAGAGCAWEDLEAHPTAAKYGGLPACADASANLANPSHVDVGDAHRSFAVWVRQQPQAGRVDGWWFLFPHVGLAVELVDGVAISWDGREVSHCTSAPSQPVRHDDALLSLFFSLPLDVIAAGERRRLMSDALVARHASDAYPRWRRNMSVWGKWYPFVGDVGTDRWYRATGTIVEVGSDGGVVVDWQGEAGRGRSSSALTLAQANQLLVCAGRVTPYRHDMASGAALVGRRISVYWDVMDALYTGEVLAYDAASDEHLVRYDDGQEAWEGFGTMYTSEHNVL